MDLYTLLIMGHIIGTILGAGGALIAEAQINIALRDRQVDANERALMHANYFLIRVGLAFIIISGLGLIWWHLSQGNQWVLESAKLQTKYLLAAIIIINAVALGKRWVPLWLGAAVSFTSWWGATLLGLAGRLSFTLLEFLMGYVLAVLIMAGVLHLVRKWFFKPRPAL